MKYGYSDVVMTSIFLLNYGSIYFLIFYAPERPHTFLISYSEAKYYKYTMCQNQMSDKYSLLAIT